MGNGIAWCVNPDGSNGESWNPVVGCSAISPGCANCWAAGFASRGLSERHKGLAAHGKWTAGPRFVPEALAEPLRRRKPTGYAVCLMGDLFHEGVTDEQIAAVFGVMAACPRHRFYVLTKRAERMAAWFGWVAAKGADGLVTAADACLSFGAAFMCDAGLADQWNRTLEATCLEGADDPAPPWPLPNVWLGVSVEDQARADERIPHLLRCPARVRFLSCEPLLESVDLDRWLWDEGESVENWPAVPRHPADQISWVIVGGESGPRARPFDYGWAESLKEQCAAAGTAFFFKQAGAKPIASRGELVNPDLHLGPYKYSLTDRAGADPAEWPADLCVREFPGGRLIDIL